jgi:hypothetical protein
MLLLVLAFPEKNVRGTCPLIFRGKLSHESFDCHESCSKTAMLGINNLVVFCSCRGPVRCNEKCT